MREITAYQSADGAIHASEKEAMARDDDLLGAELDGLLRMFALDITRNQEYKALLLVMKNRKDLVAPMQKIIAIIEHGTQGE